MTDSIDIYDKRQVDAKLETKADASDVYTKSETDTLLTAKADASDVYTKSETDTLLTAKADAADVYTKTETDTLLTAKADASDVYTKSEVDTALAGKQDSLPAITSGDAGKVLGVNSNEDGMEWVNTKRVVITVHSSDDGTIGLLDIINALKACSNGAIIQLNRFGLSSTDCIFGGHLFKHSEDDTFIYLRGYFKISKNSRWYDGVSININKTTNTWTAQYMDAYTATSLSFYSLSTTDTLLIESFRTIDFVS